MMQGSDQQDEIEDYSTAEPEDRVYAVYNGVSTTSLCSLGGNFNRVEDIPTSLWISRLILDMHALLLPWSLG